MSTRPLALAFALALLPALATATPQQRAIVRESGPEVEVAEIVRLVEALFGGIPEAGNRHLVVPDDNAGVYFAFYLTDWLEVRELRAFRIPKTSVMGVDTHLAAGDHAAAFTAVLAGVDRDSPSVADVGLDGIGGPGHRIGSGILRDEFDRIHFFSAGQADRAYRRWLRRAVALLGH